VYEYRISGTTRKKLIAGAPKKAIAALEPAGRNRPVVIGAPAVTHIIPAHLSSALAVSYTRKKKFKSRSRSPTVVVVSEPV
jgi:hypothetical protein